jgi:hypothetical protein
MFIDWKKSLIFTNNQINFIKNQKKKICLLPLCDLLKLIFVHSIWKIYRMKIYNFTYV